MLNQDNRGRLILLFAALVIAALTCARVAVVIPRHGGLNHVSAVWISMARDTAEGAFYRPLTTGERFGGTRYMPLHIVLHAGLIRAGLDPFTAGYLIAVSSLVVLVIGVYALLRQLGAARWVALACGVLTLATQSAQLAAVIIRADLLPAALTVWGLALTALMARRPPRALFILLPAAFFTLAWSAKVTTVFGPAAACLILLIARRRKEAFALGAVTTAGFLLVIVATEIASGNRFLLNMRACARSGTTLVDFARAPIVMLRIVAAKDPGALLFLAPAVALLTAQPRRTLSSLPGLFFAAVLLVTVVLFASPGIDYNHLLDLQIASVLLLGAAVVGRAIPSGFGLHLLAIAALLSAAVVAIDFKDHGFNSRRAHMERAVAVADRAQHDGPILSQDALVPLHAGEPVVVPDAFMMHVLSRNDPAYGDALLRQIRSQRFRAVVLISDPATQRDFLENRHFMPGFVATLEQAYAFAERIGPYRIYLPRSGS